MGQTTKVQTSNQLFVDNDVSKFRLGENEYISGSVTASGADVEIVEGIVVSRIAATGLLKPYDTAGAASGADAIVGLGIKTETVADGTTSVITLVNKGKVAQSKINFKGAETLETLGGVTGSTRRIKDILNDLGLVLEGGTELTAVDNS